MVYVFIVILLIKLYEINPQFCGSFRPDSPANCTALSTIAYQCCYIEGDPIAICYGVRAGSEINMSQITIYPIVKLTSLDCGEEQSGMIKKENLCYDLEPSNSTECAARGGNDCCFMQYDNMAFCINRKHFYSKDPKAVLECFEFHLKLNLKIILFVLISNFFL